MLKVANSVISASRITGVLPVVNGGTGVTTSTGTGNTVLSASPTLSGDVNFSTGNLVIGTSGKGIDFSITSHPAGMTSELLADYEEGSWTPTDDSGAGLSFTVYNASYTKVGRLVEIEAAIYFPATASVVGVKIAGLPFVSAPGDDNTGGLSISATNVGGNYYALISRNSSYFTINTNLDVSVTNVTYSSKVLKFFGFYHTA